MDHQRPKAIQPKLHCVVEHCRRNGITPSEERKLLALLGKRAASHELKHNSPPPAPRFR